jgi:hypothetical protein
VCGSWIASTDFTVPCDTCSGEAMCEVVQRIDGDRLQWTRDCHCSRCGAATAEVGWDETPADIRVALLDRWGAARVMATEKPVPEVPALRVFRRTGASIPEARTSVALLTGDGVTGTYVEMELLAQRLRDQAVAVRVVNGASA